MKNIIASSILATGIVAGAAIVGNKSEAPKPPAFVGDVLARASPECKAIVGHDCDGVEPQRVGNIRMGNEKQPVTKWSCKGGVLPEPAQRCLDEAASK